MEIWATMRSTLFSSADYPDATTGAFVPIHQNEFRRCVFRSSGLHLVIASFVADGAFLYHQSYTVGVESFYREPIHTNFINAVLVDANRADVLRDGQPYGVFPPSIEIKCDAHTHTYDSGSKTVTGLLGRDEVSAGGMFMDRAGRSRRQRATQQLFFIVDATPGDTLFIWCDYPPETAITYEMFRLCPAFQNWKAIEIG